MTTGRYFRLHQVVAGLIGVVSVVGSARAIEAQSDLGVTVAERPEIEIGPKATDNISLFRVMDAVLHPDGSTEIANSGTSQVLFADSDGRITGLFGGPGQGPEEFAFIRNLSLYRDSLYVFDGRLQRFAVLDSNREFVRTERFPTMTRPPAFIERLVDGSWIARIDLSGGRGGAGSLQRTKSEFYVLDADMGNPRLVATLPANIMATFEAGPQLGYREAPFSPSLEISTHQSCVYALSTDHGILWLMNSAGMVIDSLQLPMVEQEITSDDLDRWIQGMAARVPEQARPQMQAVLSNLPTPPMMPSYADLVVDALGFIWVQHFDPTPTEHASWTILGPDGRKHAEVSLPTGNILDVGTERLALLSRTDQDEEVLRIYRVNRSSTEPVASQACNH